MKPGRVVAQSENNPSLESRKLVSLAWLADRWSCSRQTCRRILRDHGIGPFFLGGEARNATLRFDLEDILRVESAAQGRGAL